MWLSKAEGDPNFEAAEIDKASIFESIFENRSSINWQIFSKVCAKAAAWGSWAGVETAAVEEDFELEVEVALEPEVSSIVFSMFLFDNFNPRKQDPLNGFEK